MDQSFRQSAVHLVSVGSVLLKSSAMWFLSSKLNILRAQDKPNSLRPLGNPQKQWNVYVSTHALLSLANLCDPWHFLYILMAVVVDIYSHIHKYSFLFKRGLNDRHSQCVTEQEGQAGESSDGLFWLKSCWPNMVNHFYSWHCLSEAILEFPERANSYAEKAFS